MLSTFISRCCVYPQVARIDTAGSSHRKVGKEGEELSASTNHQRHRTPGPWGSDARIYDVHRSLERVPRGSGDGVSGTHRRVRHPVTTSGWQARNPGYSRL